MLKSPLLVPAITSVFAVVLLLSAPACSPSVALPNGSTPISRLGSDFDPHSLSGEILASGKTTIGCIKRSSLFKFKTKGLATGPHPGSFQAKGAFRLFYHDLARLSEHFTITSHSTTISGSIVGDAGIRFLPCRKTPYVNDQLNWFSGSNSGTARVTVELHRFREVLHPGPPSTLSTNF